jgi:hypothetical protein
VNRGLIQAGNSTLNCMPETVNSRSAQFRSWSDHYSEFTLHCATYVAHDGRNQSHGCQDTEFRVAWTVYDRTRSRPGLARCRSRSTAAYGRRLGHTRSEGGSVRNGGDDSQSVGRSRHCSNPYRGGCPLPQQAPRQGTGNLHNTGIWRSSCTRNPTQSHTVENWQGYSGPSGSTSGD